MRPTARKPTPVSRATLVNSFCGSQSKGSTERQEHEHCVPGEGSGIRATAAQLSLEPDEGSLAGKAVVNRVPPACGPRLRQSAPAAVGGKSGLTSGLGPAPAVPPPVPDRPSGTGERQAAPRGGQLERARASPDPASGTA